MKIIDVVFNKLVEMEDSELTVPQVNEMLPQYNNHQVRSALVSLVEAGKIKHTMAGWTYTKKPVTEYKPFTDRVPITAAEVAEARRKVAIGSRMAAVNTRVVRESDPHIIIVTVTSKHPRCCMTDKNISYTWAEVAKYLRNRKVPLGA